MQHLSALFFLLLIPFPAAFGQTPRDSVPWFFINADIFPGEQELTKECRYPNELKLNDKVIAWPDDFDGEFTEEYSDGSSVSVVAEDCSTIISVTEENARSGTRTQYMFEPTVMIADTAYVEESTPPYDLKMTVVEFYSFR